MPRPPRRILLLVAVWTAVVAIGSGLVWTVISATGSELSGSGEAVPRPDGSVAIAPLPPPGSVSPAPSTSAPATANPPANPQPTPPAPRPSRTTGAPSPTAPPRPAAPPARTATWSGSAGVVTTRCTGSTISLVRAVPSADGYRVEVKDTGPREVEVEFEGRGEETEAETEVTATCAGGAPRYEVRRR